MPEIENDAVRLVYTAPPYTNNPDNFTLDKEDYSKFIRNVFSEAYRIIMPGGVIVSTNTDLVDQARYNKGKKEHEGLFWDKHTALQKEAEDVGFRCFDHKIWVKTSDKEFHHYDIHRYTYSHIIFYLKPGGDVLRPHDPHHAENFNPDVWFIDDNMVRNDSQGYAFEDANHPEIIKRCIDEFTVEGDIVVSPFVGSGTVPAVAEMMNRNWIGYEINRDLERLIDESIFGPRPEVYKQLKYDK